MKILIVGDFSKDDDYSFRAKHEGDILKDHYEVSMRCIHNTMKIGDINNLDIALHIINPSKYRYVNGPKNIGWIKKEDQDIYMSMLGALDEVFNDHELVPLIDRAKFGQVGHHNIPYLDGESVIFTINDNFENSKSLDLIEQFNRLVDPSEPIALAIKTSRPIDGEITALKTRLNLYPNISFYKKEVIINSPQNYNEIANLYHNFTYFVDSTNKQDKRYIDMGKAYNKYASSVEDAIELIRKKELGVEEMSTVLVDSHLNFFKERV